MNRKRSNVLFMIGTNGKKTIQNGTRDWSDPSTCPGVGEVGEIYDRLKKSHPGWNDVLQ